MTLSPLTEIPTPAIILADMQLNGAPPEAGRPLVARVAIELIVNEASKYLSNASPSNQVELLAITQKITNRILLMKNLQTLIQANFEVESKIFTPQIHEKLVSFGQELAKIVEERAPRLMELGFKPTQLGNALVKMNFDQIENCFLNEQFMRDGKIESSRVDAILNAKDPLQLHKRLMATYEMPELAPLAVHQRIILVRSKELTEERLAVAADMVKSGFESSIAMDYALASREERTWFSDKIRSYQLYSSPSALIRLAKTEPVARKEFFDMALSLIQRGSTMTDAIGLLLNKDTTERMIMVFGIALDAGLNSTAATDFAHSPKAQLSPNSRISLVKILKDLPLGFSDEHIVALATGGQKRYQPEVDKSKPVITEAEKLKSALTALVYDKFKIDRKIPETYQTRRMLAKLDAVEVINLYKVFFHSAELPDLIKKAQHPNGLFSFIDDLLINEAAFDRQRFQKTCRQYQTLINQPEKFTAKQYSTTFLELNNILSNFILSIDPDTRYRAKLIFHTWLVATAKQYYPKALEMSPEVVETIISWTINHYDPIKQKLEGKKPVSILKTFGFGMKHFYHYLMEHNLKDIPGGFRAYVLFSKLKTKEKSATSPREDAKLWEQLKSEQPGNEETITKAEAIYNQVKALQL